MPITDNFCKYIVNLDSRKLTTKNIEERDCADSFIKVILYSTSKNLKENLIKVDSKCYYYPYLTKNLTKALDARFKCRR